MLDLRYYAEWSFSSLLSLIWGEDTEVLPDEPEALEPDSWSPFPPLGVRRDEVPVEQVSDRKREKEKEGEREYKSMYEDKLSDLSTNKEKKKEDNMKYKKIALIKHKM